MHQMSCGFVIKRLEMGSSSVPSNILNNTINTIIYSITYFDKISAMCTTPLTLNLVTDV